MRSEAFEKCVDILIEEFEGGYTHHQSDPGGETKYGISKRRYPGVDIKSLTIGGAKRLYYTDYWLPLHLDNINSVAVAFEVFEFGVHAGIYTAACALQEACNMLGAQPKLVVDGVIGSRTECATNKLVKRYTKSLVMAINLIQGMHYAHLADANPTKFTVFMKGWMRRLVPRLELDCVAWD